MLAGKTLLDYINLFSPNDYKKNGKKIFKNFKEKYDKGALNPWNKTKTRWDKKISFGRKKHNELISMKQKKACKHLNYVEIYLL